MKVRYKMETWKKKLNDFFEQQTQYEERQRQKVEPDTAESNGEGEEVEGFILEKVDPAFCELTAELEQRGKQVFVAKDDIKRVLEVWSEARKEFNYTLWIDGFTIRRKYKATPKSGSGESNDGPIGKADAEPNVSNITKDDILNDFVDNYTRTMRLGRTS